MSKAPENPKDIFQEITDDYKGVFRNDLVSIILYGSATGKAYIPGKSDINFMIILTKAGIENLDKAFKTVDKWQKRNVAIPLFLTEHYVETSMDVFPIEYLNFQQNYVLVYGKDILKDLSFHHELVRLQCEREIKGKLLLLREAYMETSGKGKSLKEVIKQSIPAFVAIFEALLFLKDIEIPAEKRGMIKATCEAFGLDAGLFERLLGIKEEKTKPVEAEMNALFKAYLAEVRKLSVLADSMGE
jgi:hypothetical protein